MAIINNNTKEDLNSINDSLYEAFRNLAKEPNINQPENNITSELSLKLVNKIFINYRNAQNSCPPKNILLLG